MRRALMALLVVNLIAVVRPAFADRAEIVDIMVDGQSMAGKKVEMLGWMFVFNNHWLLSQTEMGGPKIYVDTQFLPKPDVKRLLLACSMKRCQVILNGIVGPVDFREIGLTADSVSLPPPN